MSAGGPRLVPHRIAQRESRHAAADATIRRKSISILLRKIRSGFAVNQPISVAASRWKMRK